MSYRTPQRRETESQLPVDLSALRLGAMVAALLVMASFLTTIYHVVDVVGNPNELVNVVAGALLAATVLSRILSVRWATLLAVGLLAVGIAWYLSVLPENEAFAFDAHLDYIIALLAGHSILEIVNLKAWVLAVTPGPVFLMWYLTLRRHYGVAALIGGLTVGFFVLTGDATLPVTMLGTVGAFALIGFGALERANASFASAEVVSIVLAAIVVVSLTITVVPSGAAMSYSPGTGFSDAFSYENSGTVEANLLSADQRLSIAGSIELSSEIRWTVESERKRYWRVATYDLYTGDGWVRRAEARRERGALGAPEATTRRIEQRFTAESRINTMPAAWRPTDVGGEVGSLAMVTDFGGLQPRRPLEEGESYTVTSSLVDASPRQLQDAGTDYPAPISDRYLQLPDSTPDRVGRFTETLTSRADTPYEKAVIIESALKERYDYSLDVPSPSDNVADTFLFEMDSGYCTYFATTMTVMLRSQGVPARMVVGYTPGEQIGEDKYAVRGYNSHAWVEAYFEDVGWVRFDPTPAGPRVEAEQERLEQARQNNESNVDPPGPSYTPSTPDDPTTPNETDTPDTNETTTSSPGTAETPDPGPGSGGDSEGGTGPQLPSREGLVLMAIAGLGLAATIRRSGVSGQLYRAVRLRWQPRVDPETDVTRAFERLERVLEREHRARRDGETPRQYLDAVDADDRARELALLYERARYAGDVDEAAADRAVELADAIVGGQ